MTDTDRYSGSALFRRTMPMAAQIGTHVVDDGYPLRTMQWRDPAAIGAILFLGGRDDFFEKYLEAFAQWRRSGWSVDAFDWRGHGGSPRVTAAPMVRHVASFARLVDDLTDYVESWRAETPGPHIVMGHSMGGHLLLRALTERRICPDAAVLLSPMIRIRTPIGGWLSERLAAHQVRRGHGHLGPWSESDSDANRADRFKMMTSDAERYVDEQVWIEENPSFRYGPPSWGWLAEAFASTRRLRRDPALRSLRVPLLLMLADHDRLTHSPTALRHLGRLPGVEVERFGRGVAHELLRERDDVRRAAIARIDGFIDSFARAAR